MKLKISLLALLVFCAFSFNSFAQLKLNGAGATLSFNCAKELNENAQNITINQLAAAEE